MPPPRPKPRTRRLRRALACAATIAGVLLTTAGTGHADPYAALEGSGPDGAAWRTVTDIAVYGSPGTMAWSAARLGGTARVWAGRGTGDWMGDVPHTRILGLGLGPDPVSPRFGARVFDAGSAGHSDYLAPGSPSLRNLADIALGRPSAVTRPLTF